MAVRIQKLKELPKKILSPSRDDMISMFNDAWMKTNDDVEGEGTFKQNKVSIKLDTSEDRLFSPKLMDLVGEEMKTFRAEILKSKILPISRS